MNFHARLNRMKEQLKKQSEILSPEIKEFFPEYYSKTSGILERLSNNAKLHLSLIDMWKNNGAKTFMISHDLLAAFRYTKVSEHVSNADFKYPFDTFMLEGDPLWRAPYMFGEGYREVEIHNLLFLDFERRPTLISMYPDEDSLGFIFYSCKPTALINSQDVYTIYSDSEGNKKETDNENSRLFINCMFNVFYNTVLFITDPTRSYAETEIQSVKNSAGYYQINKERHTSKQYPYILLKPPSHFKRLPSQDHIQKIGVRFMVRGHWRNQAVGEKHREHYYKWIAPFLKGPEIADVINKPYKLA